MSSWPGYVGHEDSTTQAAEWRESECAGRWKESFRCSEELAQSAAIQCCASAAPCRRQSRLPLLRPGLRLQNGERLSDENLQPIELRSVALLRAAQLLAIPDLPPVLRGHTGRGPHRYENR